MTVIPSEAAKLLAYEATVSQRTVSALDAEAWAAALDDIRLDDAIQAVTNIWRRSKDRLVPFDIRTEVRRIRTERIDANTDTSTVDADPDDVHAWLEALRQNRRRIADGDLPLRPVAQLMASTARELPSR